MDADQLKCKWVQFKGALKTRWGKFKHDHLVQCEGSYGKVATEAHERYGDKKHEQLVKGADQRHQQSVPEAVEEMSH
jgi:uncharacterized protein YjbJ (UPF0337 family)